MVCVYIKRDRFSGAGGDRGESGAGGNRGGPGAGCGRVQLGFEYIGGLMIWDV